MKKINKISTMHATVIILVILFLTLYLKMLSYSAIIPLLLLYVGLYLYYCKKAEPRLFLNLGFLLSLIMFLSFGLTFYTSLSVYFIPVAAVSMLTMLLYNDLQLAFLMSFLSSAIVCLLLNSGIGLMLTFFIGSLTSAFAVQDARNRGQLINAGFYVGGIQVVCIILLNSHLDVLLTREFLINTIRPLFLGGINVSLLVIATLKIFEYLFGALTNFSLLEMCDSNHPLLKQLEMEAPGTHYHSVRVSNLSESAADAIGANALLTRVGAFYHDIGKTIKPEYFTENQLFGYNKHDDIEPSMSRLVIINHVKEGIELAKKYKLDQRIVDFIPQHHGTSLIYFFYQKALEEAQEGETIVEANFRYPGPKPQTRETAIVMLADSVEGATRAIDEPNPAKIGDVVRKVINNKFIDGQLDECNLTLKDMEKISITFTRVLSAMYHTRVKYPEKKNDHENPGRKPADENQNSKKPALPDRKNDLEA